MSLYLVSYALTVLVLFWIREKLSGPALHIHLNVSATQRLIIRPEPIFFNAINHCDGIEVCDAVA